MITTAPIVEVTTRKLLAHLWRAGAFAYYWTASEAKRADKPKEAKEKLSFWFEADTPAPIPSDYGRYGPRHLYFSVNPTKEKGNQYQRAKKGERDIAAINALFSEFDFTHFESPAAALAHIESLHPAPSVIIFSGGGFHCYWLLLQPFVLRDDEQYTRAKSAQYAWVDYVKSDADAKDLNRVLRIPGTQNYKAKYGPDYPTVEFVKADFERLYSLSELEQLAQPAQPAPKVKRDNHINNWTTDLETAAACLKRLNPWRVEKYGAWVDVGMSLKGLGDAGLRLWDEWSQGSAKYDPDECQQKWHSFSDDGLTLGSLIHWANEDDPRPSSSAKDAQPQPAGPGPKELERLAARDKYLGAGLATCQAKEAQRQARQAELERRWQAGNCVNFEGDEEIDPDHIEYKRGFFTAAKKWRDYVLAHWPDVDADEQFKIKLAENREARPGTCGDYRKKVLPNGQNYTHRWGCGVCPDCLKRSVWIYRRALNEIQGIPSARPQNLLELLEADNFEQLDKDAPRENAPPLPQVKGDLSIVRVYGDQERLRLARKLRQVGILWRTQPITLEGEAAYDFMVNDDRGDPLGLITDERIELWIKGAEGKRASGDLLPSLDKLKTRYREALPYEVVLPELDDEGQPVDPDIFVLELPDIGTTAKLPGVVVDFEVHDAETLQAALLEIHREQARILGRRGAVNYGVYTKKKFYTRYLTLPALLADFNARQEAIRQSKRKKKG